MKVRIEHTACRRLPSFCRREVACAITAVVVNLTGAVATPAYDLHFDYTSFDNPNSPGANPHFGQAQFNVLNYPSIHGNYMMTSTDNHRPEMVANGNQLAEFYNFLQARYSEQTVKNGAAAADAINQYTVSNSARNGPRPDWLILNEISASLWPPNAGPPGNSVYRTWLLDCVTRLHDHYGYNVVTLAPFQNPGANGESWQALAEKSFIGIECYLSGTEVWNSGTDSATRLSWAQNQYQASKNSYLNRGVPDSRLFLVEHFANNNVLDSNGNAVGWGRAGLAQAADWDSVIQIRQDAIFNVGFEGFLAYSWGGNAMGVTEAEQIQHEYYYRSRRVLASQDPQWLSDSAINVNGTSIPLSWSQPLNWLGGVPNAAGAEANFWRTLTANRTITLDGSKTIGTMSFDSAFNYTMSAGTGGSLIFDNPGSAARLTSQQGSHVVTANVQLASDLIAEIYAGTFFINGQVSGAGGLVKTGAGILSLGGDNSYAGDTRAELGTLRLTSATLPNLADVYLSTDATLHLNFLGSPDIIDVFFIDGVSQATGTWGSVGSNAQFTSPLITGPGMLQVMTFVAPPLAGDFNHDGVVDAADYVVWRKGLGSNYSQTDYETWRSNFGATLAGSGSSAEPELFAAVPEPAAWLLMGVGAALLLARRALRFRIFQPTSGRS